MGAVANEEARCGRLQELSPKGVKGGTKISMMPRPAPDTLRHPGGEVRSPGSRPGCMNNLRTWLGETEFDVELPM